MKTLRFVAIAMVLALGACSAADDPSAATPAAAVPSSSVAAASARSTPASCPQGRLANGDCAGNPSAKAPALGDDRVAWQVCPELLRLTAAQMADPEKVEAIGRVAATSQNLSMAVNGQLLVDHAQLLRKSNDQKTKDTLAKTAAELAAACSKAGFKP